MYSSYLQQHKKENKIGLSQLSHPLSNSWYNSQYWLICGSSNHQTVCG